MPTRRKRQPATRTWVAGLLLALVGSLSPTPSRAATPDDPAARIVERWLRSRSLAGTEVGVSVRQVDADGLTASHREDVLMNPASGTKLLTTAVALLRLPHDLRWSTRVCGDLDGDGRVAGALVLIGGGDPKLSPAAVAKLAKDLRRAGVRRVDGGIRVDASLFGSETVPPAFDQKQTTAGYRASIGAAASNFGAVQTITRPGRKVGDRARVAVRPRSRGVELVNTVTTVVGKQDELRHRIVELPNGKTRLVISGTIGLETRRLVERRRLANPDLFTGWLLRDALRRAGVRVNGGVSLQPAGEAVPQNELARTQSATLLESLGDVNVWSNNFMAETIFRHLGRAADGGPGSWAKSQATVAEALIELGLERGSFRIVNGSGLYDATHISPLAMTRMLAAIHRRPSMRDALRASLAVSGRRGTLKSRLRGRLRGKFLGKTGTLDDVVSLSGYLTTRSGKTLAVAAIINEATAARTGALRGAIDRLVRRLWRL